MFIKADFEIKINENLSYQSEDCHLNSNFIIIKKIF